MSITINGTTNTLTAASGLTVAGNTAVTGTLSASGIFSGSAEVRALGSLGVFRAQPTDVAQGGRLYLDTLQTVNTAARNWVLASNFFSYGDCVLRISTALGGDPVSAGTTILSASSTGLAVTGTLSASGVTSVTDTTDATSTTSASLKTAGGLGVAKKTYCGDNIVMASGKGIDFSATSNGSGTTTSEVLSDYEEGAWTATVKGSVTDPTTPVTATGYYTKIGRMVTAIFDISAFDTTGAAGNIQIAGLPFTSLAVDPRNLGDMYFSRSSAACMAFLEPGSTTLTAVDASGNAVTHGSVGAGTFAAASITYFV